MAKQFKRRNYFIDKGAQGRFMAGFALASVLGGFVAVFYFRYLAHKKINDTIYSMRLPDVPLGSLLMNEMLTASLVTALLVVVLFAFTARKVFSRIDGPLKKMASSIQNIVNGDLRREVKLRENDDFQEFAAELNELVIGMNARLTKISLNAEKISQLCGQTSESGESDLAKIKLHLKEMKGEMRTFKLS